MATSSNSLSVLPSPVESSWTLEKQEKHDNVTNDENVVGSVSQSPKKTAAASSSPFRGNANGKSLNVVSSAIDNLRIQSIADITTSSSCGEDDEQEGSSENDELLVENLPSLPSHSKSSDSQQQEVTSENSVDSNPVVSHHQQQVNTNPSTESSSGEISGSQDEIDNKNSKDLVKVETVTSEDSANKGIDSKSSDDSKISGVSSIEAFDVTSESIAEASSTSTTRQEMEKDVFLPPPHSKMVNHQPGPNQNHHQVVIQNPFEQYFHQTQSNLSQGSDDSYIFTQPASVESEDASSCYRFPVYSCKMKLPPEATAGINLQTSSDVFSGIGSNVEEARLDPEVPLLKSQSESSENSSNHANIPTAGSVGTTNDTSTTITGTITNTSTANDDMTNDDDDDDNNNKDDKPSALVSVKTNDTNRRLTLTASTNTDMTPKINNLELLGRPSSPKTIPKERTLTPTRERPLAPNTDRLLTPSRARPSTTVDRPLTPKERYLAALKKPGTTVVQMSPKDRYLLAVQQAAAKCKTLVSTPKEVVTGPNTTPKSSVKAQIKRVESGRFRNSTLELSSEANSILFISPFPNQTPSPKQPTIPEQLTCLKDDEEQPAEFGCPMFVSAAAAVERPGSGELPVKQQVDVGSASSPVKSYLQLDLEAAGSGPKQEEEVVQEDNNVTITTKTQSSALGAMGALRSSLSVIWNSKPNLRLPSAGHTESQKHHQKHHTSSRKQAPTDQYSPIRSPSPRKASRTHGPTDSSTPKRPDLSTQAETEGGGGAMESLRSSLMMIWNSKPKPKLPTSESTPGKSNEEPGLANTKPAIWKSREIRSPKKSVPETRKANDDLESQNQEWPSPRGSSELSDCKRVYSEDSSDASSYRMSQRKKTRHSDGLSARQKPLPRQPGEAMGRQYLVSNQRGRSQSRERSITPIPSDEDLYDPGLLGNRGSYDSLEEVPLETKSFSDAPHQTEARRTSDAGSLVFRNSPRYTSTPSPVRQASTTETEDSFINAALKARNVDDVVVIYSGTPDKRDWHPPEQERKEHDTMVRAILERPSLIDKSIRESHQPRYWDWRRVRKWVLIGLAMLIFIATIAGCLACGITGSCGRRHIKQTDELEEEDILPLVLNLPAYTQESLKSSHTAQTKAYFWLESDPNRNDYSEARKMQRFALATLYYSTKIAQNWTVSTSWLSYDIHECYWFSSYEGMDVCEDDEIKHLVLKKNNLRGNIPPEIALLTSLVELDLSRNVLIGPIPEQLQALTSLEVLWLEKNELNGYIPAQIGSMTSLTSLALATNDLKGTIPSDLGLLTNLKKLRLFYNYLTGPVPSEFGLLDRLEILDVDVNHLSGTMPTQIGKLEKLQELWLDWNSFVGPIPSQFGSLKNLVKLYLGQAFVEDELRDEDWRGSGDYMIPTELGQLSNLQELYLDNNNLTGMIPVELSSLTSLQRVTLDNNLLTDSISPGICALFGGELESLSIDCGEVLCSCGCTCV